MHVRFWGTRGSCPAPGPETVRFGGNTTCLEVRTDDHELVIIDAVTGGGPAGATTTMVYKVYADGRLGGDLGGSAAQSVILMIIVIGLTAIQFRYVERKVQY